MVQLRTLFTIEFVLFCIIPLFLLAPLPSLWLSYVPASLILHTLLYGHLLDLFLTGDKVTGKRLEGETVIVTGGNSGIGYTTALDMAKRGARVIIGCRSEERGRQAERDLREESGSDLVFFRQIDLGSIASIREFSEKLLGEETRIDILINNAGLLNNTPGLTTDGFELVFGVNHLGPFYLTNLLLDRIKESAPSRIINVSSVAHKLGTPYLTADNVRPENSSCSTFDNYAKSKLANVLFTVELAERLQNSGVETYSLHPGLIFTNINPIFRTRLANILRLLLLSPTQGAQTSIYCAISDKVIGKSGKYFANCAEGIRFWFVNKKEANNLWRLSEEMLGIEHVHC